MRIGRLRLITRSIKDFAPYLGSGGLGDLETAYCCRFGIVDVENGQQLGHLHDFVKFLAQMAEAHRGTLSFGADVRTN